MRTAPVARRNLLAAGAAHPFPREASMLHCIRKSTALLGAALLVAGVIAHHIFAQTPTISDTVSGTFKEVVTLISDSDGIGADEPQETLYTVPEKRTLVITSIIIANDQDGATDVLIKENSSRNVALIRVPENSTFCHSFPTGVEWIGTSKVNIENQNNIGGVQDGQIHVTLNGYLKKPSSTTP
jgi:hypothetical protein